MEDKYKEYAGHPRFYEIIEELAKLHSEKNRQYASKDKPLDNFNRGAILADKLFNHSIKNKNLADLLILMGKQVVAVYDMVGDSKENCIDSLEDKLRDICIYSILAIILNKEGSKIMEKKD